MVGYYGNFKCGRCGKISYRHNSEKCKCHYEKKASESNRTYSKRLTQLLDSHRKRREENAE